MRRRKRNMIISGMVCLLLAFPHAAMGAESAMDVICSPVCAVADSDGSFLVTDTYNKGVWRVEGRSSVLYAGSNEVRDPYGEPAGGYGDGAPDKALFGEPWGIAPFLGGYAVADAKNHVIRLIDASGVRTAVGNGRPGYTDGKGMSASLNRPTGLASDERGNLYIADTNNQCIRMVSSSGAVTTYAKGLSEPTGIFYKDGTLYVAESGRHRIVAISNGQTTVVAGDGSEGMADGAAGEARFSLPQGVIVDDAGAVYVSDTGNRAVRKVENGEVTTVMAGNPDMLDSYPVTPMGLLLQGGVLYVCDNFSGMMLPVEVR